MDDSYWNGVPIWVVQIGRETTVDVIIEVEVPWLALRMQVGSDGGCHFLDQRKQGHFVECGDCDAVKDS